MFDKVNGTDSTRNALRSGRAPMEIANSWKAGRTHFDSGAEVFLYPETPFPPGPGQLTKMRPRVI
jgi:hypothetical protein